MENPSVVDQSVDRKYLENLKRQFKFICRECRREKSIIYRNDVAGKAGVCIDCTYPFRFVKIK